MLFAAALHSQQLFIIYRFGKSDTSRGWVPWMSAHKDLQVSSNQRRQRRRIWHTYVGPHSQPCGHFNFGRRSSDSRGLLYTVPDFGFSNFFGGCWASDDFETKFKYY